ncbi:guanine-N(7)-methyltransferase domain-containing protein [Fimicolochytrium jonesii]|uniref:guanine-N(7)-methyltransferase domain-containing protein n=1 Tax=Fimicolochytrium jonesii TaxID=1396493 RepID=UPI0022FF07F9|nr:guanine-N(7)-methyltransferase domain-containing protein [Fimicolochytrium jonesii]KAI8825712.1 guanine-N(7)-methyltransferase domain-containing protein [Fimicolochytrium jonesii]
MGDNVARQAGSRSEQHVNIDKRPAEPSRKRPLDDRDDRTPPETPAPPTKYLKPSPAVAKDDLSARVVAQHYNARPEVGREKRKDSPILQLKNFNNWVKSVLINKYTRRGDNVLDFCCGKGGDLLKWSKANINHLVGVDIADVSIEQAQQRFAQGRGSRFQAKFFAADCFTERIVDRLPRPDHVFDLVNCQFAFHYSFETEEKVRMGLKNITGNLRPGGMFIGTIPNAYWLVRKVEAAEGLEFGNSILKIKFETKRPYKEFGHKYWFELKDAIDDCPEYLVNFRTFERLASEYGLELVYKKPLHELYEEESRDPQYKELLYRMNVVNDQGTMSADEWESTGLYMAFAFRKRDGRK